MLPDERRGGARRRDEAGDDLPRQAREVEHVEARRGDQERRAEIGLALDEIDRHGDQHRGEREVLPADAAFELLEIPREHQRQRDLHELRRLEPPEAEIEPPPRAVDDDAPQRHRDEQHDAERVERHRGARDRLRRNVGDDPHQHQREREARHLAPHAREALVGRREQRDEPHARDRQRHAEQEAVDAPRQELPQPARRSCPISRSGLRCRAPRRPAPVPPSFRRRGQ